jgi:hypothetical protein
MILTDAAERVATAYHEAGHAVMALLLGREPKGASIQRRGDVAGFVDFDKDFPASMLSYFDKSEPKRIYFEMRVMITVAGTVAHDILTPGRPHDAGDDMDDREARDLFLDHWEASNDEREAYIGRLVGRARDALLASWPAVERVARALLENGELSRSELRERFDAK